MKSLLNIKSMAFMAFVFCSIHTANAQTVTELTTKLTREEAMAVEVFQKATGLTVSAIETNVPENFLKHLMKDSDGAGSKYSSFQEVFIKTTNDLEFNCYLNRVDMGKHTEYREVYQLESCVVKGSFFENILGKVWIKKSK